MTKFWWGQKKDERKIHWLIWYSLCRSKDQGGVGFRNLRAFNLAMLSKQCWRLASNESSLLSQFLKAGCYPRGSFMSTAPGYKPSFTWQSFMRARHLIDQGSRWLIGNGARVCVWGDKWVSSLPYQKVISEPLALDPDVYVSKLIDHDASYWR
ncbi:uncharacterized mitochondrial protein AtMg00310-like [Jatropha curcas]|uniref:uncharacterized mitochondrial protein AtMg00310-like n=1 Tax=Jatropha curcas TaxID=180498 RepID=UPI0018940847|nr:uncharacterized mitochondrial protein AtMg00310-like [Jatropha curcas]